MKRKLFLVKKTNTNMKKILLINAYYQPNFIGGAEILSKNLEEGLTKNGYIVKVITNMPGKKFSDKNIINLNIKVSPYLIGLGLPSIKVYWKVKKIISEYKPNTIIIKNLHSTLSTAPIYASIGYKTLYFLWDYWFFCFCTLERHLNHLHCDNDFNICIKEKNADFKYVNTISNIFFTKIIYFIRHFSFYLSSIFINKFIVSNELLINLLKTKYGVNRKKIIKFPLGINTNEFKYSFTPIKNNKKINIGYIGTLIKAKGLHLLIKSLHELGNNYKLYVIGIGKDELLFKDLVNKYNLNKNIVFLGKKGREEIKKFFNKIQIFCLPVVWPDVFPQVGMESMFAGKILIASKTGGIPEYLKNKKNGFMFERNNEKDLTKTIKLVSKLSLKKQKIISQNAHEEIKNNFNFNIFLKNVIFQIEKK